MIRIEAISKKRGFDIWYPFLLNGIVLCGYLLCFTVSFESIDNIIFSQWIADGYYNIFYTNYYLTRALGFLQDLIFPLNAYTIVHIALAYLAYTGISVVLSDKFGYKSATFMTAVVTMLFGVNNYITISFTRLPGLLCAAGLLMILHYSAKKGFIGVVLGSLLTIAGGLYRFNVFELALGMALVFAGCLTLNRFIGLPKEKRRFSSLLKLVFEPKRLVAAVLIFSLCYVLNVESKKINTSTEELRYYSTYTNLRSSIWDYQIPDYSDCREEYDALGIDANDIELIREGFCDKDGVMSVDNMREIQSIRDEFNKSDNSYASFLRTSYSYAGSRIKSFNIEFIASVLFALIFLLYIVLHKEQSIFIPIVFLITVLAVYGYFLYTGRIKYRVMFTVWFSAFVYLFYLIDTKAMRPEIKNIFVRYKKRFVCIGVPLILVFCVGCTIFLNKQNIIIDHSEMNETMDELYEYMEEKPENKYVLVKLISTVNDLPNRYDSAFVAVKTDYSANFKHTDCTYYASPFRNRQMEAFGTDNLFASLVDDGVYCVFSREKFLHYPLMIYDYLEKYYCPGELLDYEVVDELENFVIAKYYYISDD